MSNDTAKMISDKARFVRGIETLLSLDKRSDIDSLAYRVELHDDSEECYDEYIDIIWVGGSTNTILATGNSNGANLKAIAKEVY